MPKFFRECIMMLRGSMIRDHGTKVVFVQASVAHCLEVEVVEVVTFHISLNSTKDNLLGSFMLYFGLLKGNKTTIIITLVIIVFSLSEVHLLGFLA